MLELTREEHQQLVLMVGSQKEWATYLGLDPKTARSIWIEYALRSPTQYVREMGTSDLVNAVICHRSAKRAAEWLGVSESFLLKHLEKREIYAPLLDLNPIGWTEEECRRHFARYKSVRLVARICQRQEAAVRAEVTRLGLELATLVDFAHGGHSNAKGRRAELEYAKIRGDRITRDLVKDVGPTAEYDFDDAEYGRVNVKSGRCFTYTARSRQNNKFYWKFSTRGRDKCDALVCMFYSEDLTTLFGWKLIPRAEIPRGESFSLTLNEVTFTGKLKSVLARL